MKRGPGRPPHPDVLTPAEWRVLEQLRAGKANAEIAVRLGVSVNTVKYHVANILGKLGVADREAAAAWDGAPRRVRVLAPLAWLVGRVGWSTAGVAGVGVMVVVVALIGGGSCAGSRGLVTATVEPTLAVAAPTEVTSTPVVVVVAATEVAGASEVAAAGLPFEQHADYREYESAELEAAGFVDTGAFLQIPYNRIPAAEVSYRAGFTGVRAYSDGYVSFAGSSMWSPGTSGASWSSTSAVGLKAEVEGQTLYLTFSAEWGVVGGTPMTRLIKAGLQGVAFYSVDAEDRRPELIVAVTDAEGLGYPAIIDTFGHLWVRPVPMLGGPVANDTGELLGVATAERLGPFPRGIGNWQHLTWCEGEACIVVLRSADGLNAPSAGTARCAGGEDGIGIDFEAGGKRIHFQSAGVMGGAVPRECDEDFPRDVSVGERLSGFAVWIVTAFDSSGEQIDITAEGEWLYIDIEPRTIHECPPCYTGT